MRRGIRGSAVLALIVGFAVNAGSARPADATHGTPEDEAIARAAVLRSGDLPSGWTEDVGQNHLAAFIDAAKSVRQCKWIRYDRKFDSAGPNAVSSDFLSATSVVSNDATTTNSITYADYTFEDYRLGRTGECLGKVLPKIVKKDLARQAKVGKVSTTLVTPTTPTVDGADAAYGYRLVLEATIDGRNTDVYVDNWLVQVGRTLTSFDFENRGAQFDQQIATAAANTSTARVIAAAVGTPAAGETPFLAKYLPRVEGYRFEQPPVPVQQFNEELLRQPDIAFQLDGLSTHSVLNEQGETIALLTLFEYKPEIAALPGFRKSVLANDSRDLATSDVGTGAVINSRIDGTQVELVPTTGGWAWRLFVCGRISTWVEGFEDRGVSVDAIDRFVKELVIATC